MAEVLEGRWTVPADSEVVVFLIGTRINKVRDVRTWWPVVTAMSRMLLEAQQDRTRGLLSARTFISGRTILVRQYWASVEQLQTYAHDADAAHLPAWREFNRRARGARGAVGIFHETYPAAAGAFETVQVDMPAGGVHEAVGVVPVSGGRDSARERLNPDHPVTSPAA